MSQQELLGKVIAVLDQMGVESMLTGSWASSVHGYPRATHDVDLVVDLQLAHVEPLLQAFPPPNYYLSPQAMRDAIQRRKMFNLLDTVDGDKVDFWILSSNPYDLARFARRQEASLGDVRLFVASPEDMIVSKLLWAEKSGGSEKQFNDALQIYILQEPFLDQNLMRHWARELKVEAGLQRLIKTAEQSDDEQSIDFP